MPIGNVCMPLYRCVEEVRAVWRRWTNKQLGHRALTFVTLKCGIVLLLSCHLYPSRHTYFKVLLLQLNMPYQDRHRKTKTDWDQSSSFHTLVYPKDIRMPVDKHEGVRCVSMTESRPGSGCIVNSCTTLQSVARSSPVTWWAPRPPHPDTGPCSLSSTSKLGLGIRRWTTK